MKKLFIIGNWKSYKTVQEAKQWMEQFASFNPTFSTDKTIVVCPPFTLLAMISASIEEKRLPLAIGSQDISAFPTGAYTGGVNAEQLKELVTYAIIGHSERRRFFAETDEILAKKVDQALAAGIVPIYCVQGKDDVIPQHVTLVGYEPVSAIGSGNPDTPENAESVAAYIKQQNPQVTYVVYGGSVTPDNVNAFTRQPHIDGVLVGGASLDAKKFFDIANNA